MTTLATLAYHFALFNRGVENARIYYQRRPNTACIYPLCDRLARDGYMCIHHKRARTVAANRMQRIRAAAACPPHSWVTDDNGDRTPVHGFDTYCEKCGAQPPEETVE